LTKSIIILDGRHSKIRIIETFEKFWCLRASFINHNETHHISAKTYSKNRQKHTADLLTIDIFLSLSQTNAGLWSI